MDERQHPALEIEGVEEALEPRTYKEEWDDQEGLAIHARVEVTRPLGEQLRRLWRETRAAGRYFGVRRAGDDAEPRQMRFGMPIWSRHADREKHEIILVDRSYDDGKKMRWPEGPEQQAETGQVIRTAEQMDVLLDLLVERGKLSAQDVERVRTVSDERLWERLLEFRRVDDLDEW